MSDARTVTALLHEASRGDRTALSEVFPLVYETLRKLAHRELRHERPGHTLSTTALAHEAYLRLVGLERIEWQDRSHFFAMAARALRRVLVDHALARNARKRGGGATRLDLDETMLVSDESLDDILALNDALDRLAAVDPRVVQVVECRVFMGMTIEETSAALGFSAASAKRHWNAARVWLTRELS